MQKIKTDRLKKLAALSLAGIDSYPVKTQRTHTIAQALENFDSLAEEGKEIFLVGRSMALRIHGGATFVNLKDASGVLQLYFKKDELGENLYQLLVDNFDIGDFIEVAGKLFKTQKGEQTLLVKKYRILAKSLNQLPAKWHGLKDIEERFRRRYLDLLMNREVSERFQLRAKIIKELRTFLEMEGFMEVETPILQPLPGGALAKPFKTHLEALNLDLYLRVAPELYHKRLLVAGFEKIYELGRCFRNEGMDKFHNPDFTILEFYWAYADYEQLMDFTERMFQVLVPELEIEYQGQKINFAPPFKRISLRELILRHYKVDIAEAAKSELQKVLKQVGEKPEKSMPECKMIDDLFKIIRPEVIQPTFVTDHLIEMSPLAKRLPDNPGEAARFQLIAGGLELANAYSELNDPQEQAERMKEQEKQRAQDEIQRYDQDFIEALEYGMPPAAGWGLGVDRLVMLLTDAPSLREVILFPAMRSKE